MIVRVRALIVVVVVGACAAVASAATGGPVAGRFAVIAPVAGRVGYIPAGGHTAIALSGPVRIAIGSEIDATGGTVRVTTASGMGTQVGSFSGGRARVEQPSRQQGFLTTTLVLGGGNFGVCRSSGSAPTVRQLSADVIRGGWSVRGATATASAYAAARWQTDDTCAGTTITVQQGTVVVADRRAGRTVSIPPGQTFVPGFGTTPGTVEAVKLGGLFGTAPAPVVFVGSVACTSTGNCVAVGYGADPAGNDLPLIVAQTNGIWGTAVEPPLPPNAAPVQGGTGGLSGVSCPVAGDCVAVGTYLDTAGHDQPMAITETAGVWAPAIELSLPADAIASSGGQSAVLDAVACASPGTCAATGSYLNATDGRKAMIASESGGTWSTPTILTMPANAAAPVGPFGPGRLSSISCPSPGACVVVGDYADVAGNLEPLAADESAGEWGAATPLVAPSGAQQADLTSVSCPATGSCAAVGSYVAANGQQVPFLAAQTAGEWTSAAGPPLPAAAVTGTNAALASVSCTGVGDCLATGTYEGPGESGAAARAVNPVKGDTGDNAAVLVATEVGGSWTAARNVALPGDAARPETEVSAPSVSCATGGSCTAVGWYGLLHGGTAPMAVLVAPG